MKKYLNFATAYLGLGLVLGVFFREFTKLNGFEGQTVLGTAHTHTLVLGFIFFLILMVLEKTFNISEVKNMKWCIVAYNVALVYMLGTIVARGVMEVLGTQFAGMNHISGLAHAMLGASLIWFVVLLRKVIK